MRVTMDELHRHNQTLEDNVHKIKRRQHDSHPRKENGIMGPLTTLRQDMGAAYPRWFQTSIIGQVLWVQ